MTAELTVIFLAVCTAATLGASFSRNRVPLAASIALAAVLRVGFAALTSRHYTPNDVAVFFRTTADLILAGKDPVHDMAGRNWNFLELMPVVHAAELRSGLPWVYAVKIAPILADLVLVWMVARFSITDGHTRALQYAVNPVSLLVVSLHGQVEPVALALALGGMLLIRSGRPVAGGVLLGAAIAAKTWPAAILLAVLPLRDAPRLLRIVAGSIIVPALCLLGGVIFLDTRPVADLGHIVSYSSYVAFWTWSAAIIDLGHKNFAGYSSPLAPVGTSLVLIGVVLTLVLLRRRAPEVRALGVLCAALVLTAGFGGQYLLWALPLMMALVGGTRSVYIVAATGWGAVFYLKPFVTPSVNLTYLQALSWLPAAVLAAVLVELIRRPVHETPAVGPAMPESDPG